MKRSISLTNNLNLLVKDTVNFNDSGCASENKHTHDCMAVKAIPACSIFDNEVPVKLARVEKKQIALPTLDIDSILEMSLVKARLLLFEEDNAGLSSDEKEEMRKLTRDMKSIPLKDSPRSMNEIEDLLNVVHSRSPRSEPVPSV